MKVKISRQLWQSLGSKMGWMEINAMAVPAPSPEVVNKMKEQGLFFLQSIINRMPHTTQKDMKAALDKVVETGATDLFTSLDAKEVIDLPAIYAPDPNEVFEYNGKKYIAIDVKEPRLMGQKKTYYGTEYKKGDQYPGHAICLNIDTGKVEPILLSEVQSKITPSTENREFTLKKLNEEVQSYNEKINAINKSTGAYKLAMQVLSAEMKVDQRLKDLEGIKNAVTAKMERAQGNPMEAYKMMEDELRQGIASGKYNEKDIFDTLLFLYQGNPAQLVSEIQSGAIKVPDSINANLLAAAAQENKGIEAYRQEKEKETLEREQRIRQKEVPADIHEEEIRPFNLQEIPGSKYRKVDELKSFHHLVGGLRQTLKSVQRDFDELTQIKNSFAGLRKYLGALEAGQRSKEFLATNEGKTILSQLNDFLTKSEMFIKRYATDIIQDGKINPQLMGREGTIGNSLLAVALTKIYNVIKGTVEEALSAPTPAVKTEPAIPTPVASSNLKMKISNALWDAFQKRFK